MARRERLDQRRRKRLAQGHEMSRPPAPLPKARGDIVCTNQYALSYLSPWSQPSSVAEVRSRKDRARRPSRSSPPPAPPTRWTKSRPNSRGARGLKSAQSYASSSTLAQQIENGADADLFLSADVKWADHLEAKVPIARRRTLLGNRLVIVVPAVSKLALTRPDDLLSDQVRHLALGDPQAVPAGIYARQALTRLGVWRNSRTRSLRPMMSATPCSTWKQGRRRRESFTPPMPP